MHVMLFPAETRGLIEAVHSANAVRFGRVLFPAETRGLIEVKPSANWFADFTRLGDAITKTIQ